MSEASAPVIAAASTAELPVGFREAVIDVSAIEANVRLLRRVTGTEHFIAVVKANGYGHGAVAAARAALAGGADVLGVAAIGEALELRTAGIDAPVIAWLHDPDETFDAALAASVTVGVSSEAQLRAVADAARRAGTSASVHLKIDTGLSRNGMPRAAWDGCFALAASLSAAGLLRVDGVFTHLSNASLEDDAAALHEFDEAVAAVRAAGLRPTMVHAAASCAALRQPEARYNAVRIGISIYGLSPMQDAAGARDLGLRPAMTLRGRVAGVKRVPADAGVSYDYTYRTSSESTLALVPFGYGDGIPRAASNRAPVVIGGRAYPIAGRVAMDQFVVDVGDAEIAVGDEVVLFGDASAGVPAVEDWAEACETINWELVTRIGGRVVRRYVGE